MESAALNVHKMELAFRLRSLIARRISFLSSRSYESIYMAKMSYFILKLQFEGYIHLILYYVVVLYYTDIVYCKFS